MDNDKLSRKSLRLHHYDYTQAGMYFVTVCAAQRRCLFGTIAGDVVRLSEAGQVVEQSWLEFPRHFPHMSLDTFVVMPNHVHGIVTLDAQKPGAINRAPTLGEIIRSYKARCTHALRRGAIHRARNTSEWQRGYYEHVIRNDTDLARIREYIGNNPLQWALDRNNPAWDGHDHSRPYGL